MRLKHFILDCLAAIQAIPLLLSHVLNRALVLWWAAFVGASTLLGVALLLCVRWLGGEWFAQAVASGQWWALGMVMALLSGVVLAVASAQTLRVLLAASGLLAEQEWTAQASANANASVYDSAHGSAHDSAQITHSFASMASAFHAEREKSRDRSEWLRITADRIEAQTEAIRAAQRSSVFENTAVANASAETESEIRGAEFHDEFQQMLFENSLVGVAVVNAEGAFDDVSVHFAALFGYERADLIGQHFSLLLPPHLRNEAVERSAELFEQWRHRSSVWQALHNNGDTIAVQLAMRSVRGSDGTAKLGMVCKPLVSAASALAPHTPQV